MARSAADLLMARRVSGNYRLMAERIDDVAADPKLERSMPLTVRVLRKYARIARNAALFEELDPDPTERRAAS